MNKKVIFSLLLTAMTTTTAKAQEFDRYFEDATMRLDYIFAGNVNEQHIYLEDIKRQERWAGRKSRLSEKFLNGNGQLTVQDHQTKDTLYIWTFSTLFQEWLNEPEAKQVDRAFESCYNIPYPKEKIDVTISLTDKHNKVMARMTHTVDPKDILIRHIGANGIPFHYIWKGQPNGEATTHTRSFYNRTWMPTPYDEMKDVNLTDCIDLAILADGYTEAEMGKFYTDCERAVEALFTWEPFKSLKNKFNVVAVGAPSLDSGPSVPLEGRWSRTASGCHYSTFYSDRYLTTQNMCRVYDLLSCVPFEHIMILENTDTYGGGGIYNQVTLATSDHPTFKQVFVHEFGHEYAGLADEYAYNGADAEEWYPADTEPWEPNITTLKDFSCKWADLMPKKQPIPTPLDPKVPDFKKINLNDAKQVEALNKCTQVVGVFEGAGYQEKGCYRPAQECRMKINEVEDFCPVCARAIRRITEFYTSK